MGRRAGACAAAVAAVGLLAGATGARPAAAGGGGGPPRVGVFYESECPGCRDFIENMLEPALGQGLGEAVDLEMVPYGNAKHVAGGSIRCQHGPLECTLNRWEQCALGLYGRDDALPFIFCLEDASTDPSEDKARACAAKLGYDAGELEQCTTSEQGDLYERSAGALTDALKPPHQWVPWVTVNGVNVCKDDGCDSFIPTVCEALKTRKQSLPKFCEQAPASARATEFPGVCPNEPLSPA